MRGAWGRPAGSPLYDHSASSAVPGFSSSYLLLALRPSLGRSPPRVSAAGSSPLAKSSLPVGTRDGACELSSPAASTFSRRHTQHRSCHRIPKVPASEQAAPPGPSPSGEHSADSLEQRKQSGHRSKVMFRAPVPQREGRVQGERSARTAGHRYLLVLLFAQRERELQLPFFVCTGKWRKWLLATEEIG